MQNFFENLVNSINLFDIFFLLIMIYTIIQCFIKGFSLSFISFMKWVLSVVITIILVPKLQPFVGEHIESEFVNNFGIGIEDAGVAIIVAILLFMIPSSINKNMDLMQWDKTTKLPWGLLILFGGGLSLAAQVSNTGLGIWIGQGLTVLKLVHPIILVLAIATMIIFLTEMTSNVATTSTFLPVIGALAIAIGVVPVSLTIPVCLAASCAFMLPVATPPNAIVYGSGKFTIATMMKAGFFLNLVGILVVTLFSYYLAPVVF